MNVAVYYKIISFINEYKGLTCNCLKALKKQFSDISDDTLFSILSLEYQRRMKHMYNKSPTVKNKYWIEYNRGIANSEAPGVIVRMAEKYEIAPCLIAKLILQKYVERLDDSQSKLNHNAYLRDSNLIKDKDLAYEVFLCNIYDNLYSPRTDIMKHSLGQQYEMLLTRQVVKLGLAFRDEEHLRKHGYDKTPDIKLDVPIAIDGFVVNWIESKALFGNPHVHEEYKKNQYLSYWNRFGPGLVIYWFGYLETLEKDNRFIIRDHLTTNIIKPEVPFLLDSDEVFEYQTKDETDTS